MKSALQENARALEQELAWLIQVIDKRFRLYFNEKSEDGDVFDLKPPNFKKSASQYTQIVQHYQFSFAERLCLILSLCSYIRPRLLDIFFTKNKIFDRKFTEFGGVRQGKEEDFVPTGETLAFLVSGQGLELRFALHSIFSRDHVFTKHNILDFETNIVSQSPLKSPLWLSEEYLNYFTTGEQLRPHFSPQFPAQYIDTKLEWQSLVLNPQTLERIKEIETWIKHQDTLLNDWGMAGKIRPGYRALFHGPPGTGKTLTASLLGKSTGHEVYRVDISTVVSKYIGETEKNLARVFDQAENKSWILFFDEADALFGKRSETKNAQDRYANQEVSYLLQRIETFNGIIILASNLKENLDEAFSRRFESIIYFPVPSARERFQLWQKGFSAKAKLDTDVDLSSIAKKFELSGGTIMNIIRFVSLKAIERGDDIVTQKVLMQGIRREFQKEGKM